MKVDIALKETRIIAECLSVIFFKEIISNELNLDTETDINEFRNTIRETIINNSIKI